MLSPLGLRHHDPVFRSLAVPTVLLDPDLVIRAATPSYLLATGRDETEVLDAHLFDAFPENDATREIGSGEALVGSLQRVLRTGRPHDLGSLRYDVADHTDPDRFVERRWLLVNSAVFDGPRPTAISMQVRDVTAVGRDVLEALRHYRELLADGDLRSGAQRRRVEEASALVDVVEDYDRLAAEVAQLHEAMTSRSTIEQAKGIVMADRRCSADEAFAVLRRLSQDSNVRLAHVAAALVRQATR
jgi:hypothetical protein